MFKIQTENGHIIEAKATILGETTITIDGRYYTTFYGNHHDCPQELSKIHQAIRDGLIPFVDYPTPGQLLTKLLEMICNGNEPGPGVNPTVLWEDGIHIEATRRETEYAIRLEANGKQSRPVFYLRTKDGKPKWEPAPNPVLLVKQWLEVINPQRDNIPFSGEPVQNNKPETTLSDIGLEAR